MVPAKKRSILPSASRRRASRAGSFVSVLGQLLLERELEPAAHLGGRLAREGDGGHVLDLVHAARDAGGHARGHLVRLAGAGAGFDEHRAREFRADAIAGGLVCRSSSYSWLTSFRKGASAGSACLFAAVACASLPHA